MSSPDVGIDVGIYSDAGQRASETKTCSTSDEPLFWGRVKWGAIGWLDQIQFDGSLDSRPAIRDVEFTVDALGMGADRA